MPAAVVSVKVPSGLSGALAITWPEGSTSIALTMSGLRPESRLAWPKRLAAAGTESKQTDVPSALVGQVDEMAESGDWVASGAGVADAGQVCVEVRVGSGVVDETRVTPVVAVPKTISVAVRVGLPVSVGVADRVSVTAGVADRVRATVGVEVDPMLTEEFGGNVGVALETACCALTALTLK